VSNGIITWNLDWACPGCRKYGAIQLQITGGTRDAVTGKLNPKQDDEQFVRLLYEAHRKETAPLYCLRPVKSLLIGNMWRHQRTTTGVETIVKERKGAPPMKEYAWPPKGW
jgi:hypothetical protein